MNIAPNGRNLFYERTSRNVSVVERMYFKLIFLITPQLFMQRQCEFVVFWKSNIILVGMKGHIVPNCLMTVRCVRRKKEEKDKCNLFFFNHSTVEILIFCFQGARLSSHFQVVMSNSCPGFLKVFRFFYCFHSFSAQGLYLAKNVFVCLLCHFTLSCESFMHKKRHLKVL